MMETIARLAGGEFNINSPKQLATVALRKARLETDPQNQDRILDR